MNLEVLLSLLALILLYLISHAIRAVISYYKVCKAVKHVPGWPAHWLYGNLHQKSKRDYDMELYKWVKENGVGISKEWMGPFTVRISIHDPDLLKSAVKSPKADLVYKMFGPWLGRGLLLANGKRWARNRRLLTGAFHFDILKPYIVTYNTGMDELIAIWSEHASKTPDLPIMIYKGISHLTLDILLKCAFSYDSNCQKPGTDSAYINAVFSMTEPIVARASSFHLLLSNFIYLNFTSKGREFKRACDIVHVHAKDIIKERKKVLGLDMSALSNVDMNEVVMQAKQNHKHLDFLDILLTACDDNGTGLTDTEIRCEVDTFMFEGFDTTAHALSWTLYCLAKHPEHQDKCREEINEVLGDRQYLEYEDLAKLSYLMCCIKETLRLYPPVYAVKRQVEADTKIGEFMIPKDVVLNIRIFNIQRSPKHWENPDDFDPQRFSSPVNKSSDNPFAYIPFSAGPRNCIGQHFAMNEERVVLGRLLKEFKFRLADGYDADISFGLLLDSKEDVQLVLEKL